MDACGRPGSQARLRHRELTRLVGAYPRPPASTEQHGQREREVGPVARGRRLLRASVVRRPCVAVAIAAWHVQPGEEERSSRWPLRRDRIRGDPRRRLKRPGASAGPDAFSRVDASARARRPACWQDGGHGSLGCWGRRPGSPALRRRLRSAHRGHAQARLGRRRGHLSHGLPATAGLACLRVGPSASAALRLLGLFRRRGRHPDGLRRQ